MSVRLITAKEDYHPYTISKIDPMKYAIITFNLREIRLIRNTWFFVWYMNFFFYLFNLAKFKCVLRHLRRIRTFLNIFLSNTNKYAYKELISFRILFIMVFIRYCIWKYSRISWLFEYQYFFYIFYI